MMVLFVGLFVLFLNMISMFAQELSCFLFTLLGRLFLQHHLGVLLSCLCSLFWRLFSTKNFDGFIIPVIEYMLFLLFISMQSEHMADSALDFVLFTLIYNKYEILVYKMCSIVFPQGNSFFIFPFFKFLVLAFLLNWADHKGKKTHIFIRLLW